MGTTGKLILFLLLLGSVAGAQSCQALEEVGATSIPEYPNLKEIPLGALIDLLSSRGLLGDTRRASFMFEGEAYDPNSRTAAACFSPLLFLTQGFETLITYNLAEGRKVSEADVFGLPFEVLPITKEVFAVTLLLPGVGTSAAIVNFERGHALFGAGSGRFSDSSIGLVLGNRVLVESSSWGSGRSSSSLTLYEVERGTARELDTCVMDAPPADDYAVSSRGIYALNGGSERFEGRLLPQCREVSAALLNPSTR